MGLITSQPIPLATEGRPYLPGPTLNQTPFPDPSGNGSRQLCEVILTRSCISEMSLRHRLLRRRDQDPCPDLSFQSPPELRIMLARQVFCKCLRTGQASPCIGESTFFRAAFFGPAIESNRRKDSGHVCNHAGIPAGRTRLAGGLFNRAQACHCRDVSVWLIPLPWISWGKGDFWEDSPKNFRPISAFRDSPTIRSPLGRTD